MLTRTEITKNGYKQHKHISESKAQSVHDQYRRSSLSELADKWSKKAEGRVNSLKYRSMQVGDTILFCDKKTGYYIFGKIKFKHEYNSFEKMLTTEGVSNMLPFLEDHELAEGVDVYNAFPRASRVHEFGCVAIGITVLKFNLRPITSIP